MPIWVLGSTVNGASIAGQLGLPFSVASHFAPNQVDQAIEVYRDAFTADAPTAQITEPYVMAGINVMIADTDEEAQREFTVIEQMFGDVLTGKSRKLQPPVDPGRLPGSGTNPMLQIKAVGSPETAKEQLEAFGEAHRCRRAHYLHLRLRSCRAQPFAAAACRKLVLSS